MRRGLGRYYREQRGMTWWQHWRAVLGLHPVPLWRRVARRVRRTDVG